MITCQFRETILISPAVDIYQVFQICRLGYHDPKRPQPRPDSRVTETARYDTPRQGRIQGCVCYEGGLTPRGFCFACQYMKIPTDLDPTPPPPTWRIPAQNPPPRISRYAPGRRPYSIQMPQPSVDGKYQILKIIVSKIGGWWYVPMDVERVCASIKERYGGSIV